MQTKPKFDWRLKLGLVMFTLSITLPIVGVPVVVVMDISETMKASVSGGLLVTGELLGLGAVAVMGKEGYLFIKGHLFKFLKQHASADQVGKVRYRIGLLMFSLPLLFGWISPYLLPFILDQEQLPLAYAIVSDLLFLASFFVLGGDFWDKVRALFDQKLKICLSIST